MIYDCFRVTGTHDTVLDYADLFTITLRNDDVQEFDMRWDDILLSMTKIPPDDVLEYVSLINSKPYWNRLILGFIRNYRCSSIKNKRRWRREPSLLYPSQMSTTSLSTPSTCTPVRPSSRPSTGPLLTLSSHGAYTCDDSSNVSFGPVPEEIKPMFLHKSSMTWT